MPDPNATNPGGEQQDVPNQDGALNTEAAIPVIVDPNGPGLEDDIIQQLTSEQQEIMQYLYDIWAAPEPDEDLQPSELLALYGAGEVGSSLQYP